MLAKYTSRVRPALAVTDAQRTYINCQVNMNESNNIKNVQNKDLSKMYKIFEEIYSKAPPFLKDLSTISVDIDYTESILEEIDFKKIDAKFKNGEYCLITDAIKDIRTVFLNCYSFYGARSDYTKKSLKLEELLEEKISYLDKNFKLLADVNLTFKLLNMEGKPSSKLSYPKDCYDSVLLRSVAHYRPERLKKYHKTLSTTFTTDKDNAHILEKISSWENKVNFNNIFYGYISSMWELPEIGNFLAILFKKLDLNIINQVVIERMFLMPKESTTMGKVMTILLMSIKKTKCIGQLMPYKVWSEKLSKIVSDWCKVYHSKKQNKVIVMNLLGIHPDFWAIVNEKNPLIEKDYSKLSYFIKVWLVKGLCDYVSVKSKTINGIVTNCNARQCTIWKNDLGTEEYFFFDSMPDFRIYYYNIPYDEPCLEFLKSAKTDNEVVRFKDNITMNGFSEGSHTEQKGQHFKLIADSVKHLRDFVYELHMKETSIPENLISSLENFIVNIESEENNYIVMNNDSKIKLFKDWVSYSDRIQKDKDNISVWEKKDSKSVAKAKNEELIIAGKRQRKLIIQQNVVTNESDEDVSEKDKPLSDFTDSEDEWGAMNQPKNKVKQPRQTPSKYILEIEKRVLKTNKMLKDDTNQSNDKQLKNEDENLKHRSNKVCKTNKKDKSMKSVKFLKTQNELKCSNDTDSSVNGNNKVKQPRQTFPKHIKLKNRLREEDKVLKHRSNKVCKTNKKDKSIKSAKLLKSQNEVKCSNNTDIFDNGHNKRLVLTKNIDIVCSDEEVILIDSDKEENQKSPDGLQPVEIINLDEDMQNDCEVFNDNFESASTSTKNRNRKTNEQNNYKQIESAVILIEDDQIIISDDENDVQFISMIRKPVCSPLKNNKSCGLKTNLNKSYNSVSVNRGITSTNCIEHKAKSSIIHQISQGVTIMPANINIPKGIEVTMVKTPQTSIDSNFNSIKKKSTMSNGHPPSNPSTIDVKCEIISKPDLNGEVKFYVKLPNGKYHPGPNELINQYLKQHNNQLPNYWDVTLPVEVAKQYGFN